MTCQGALFMLLSANSRFASASFLKKLPALSLCNGFARLDKNFFTRLPPTPLPSPYLVGFSQGAAALLGWPPEVAECPDFIEVFAGNRSLPDFEPLASVYSGHQFGVWAGQLGDGRAHWLGE